MTARRKPRASAAVAAALVLLLGAAAYIAYVWQPRASQYESAYLAQIESRYADTGGVRFHYTVTGEGPPVVLLAGGAMWLHSWRETIPALAESHTVYAVDMPSQGYTEVRDEDFAYDLDGMAGAIEAFLDAVGLDRASLVGHSWGGAWSLYFAETRPDRVDRLVLLDAPGLDAERARQTEVFKVPLLGEAAANLTTREFYADSLRSAFSNAERVTDDVVDEGWAWFSRPTQRDAFVALARGLDFDETHERLGDVAAPTLILWGAEDSWLPATQAQGLADRIPDAAAEVIPGCGHNVHEDCPDAAVPLVTEFLAA
ncbi:alpha/beta fold hydrolase [Glycomyces terrestris]|uniref:Alpha/beta fold hydrolase n=1 Tax=Glycomyces terrestris TaxID=2493553 RepID=A0A426V2Z0_9ACTN|nr:alpha/beta fold hydrolase [Glycomyces terrestris]RRS01274.1 alpha/beta fold hydrolase [Glycomyces terrestris]